MQLGNMLQGLDARKKEKRKSISNLLVKVELECKWNLMLTISRSATATNVAHASRVSILVGV
jgi:hypothetical protein